jgi:hypothetical protein
MEELNTPEEHEENLNEEQSEEISRTDAIECPNCQYTGKAVFETMRRTDTHKVKPFEIMACKNCGTIFCDVDTLEDIF